MATVSDLLVRIGADWSQLGQALAQAEVGINGFIVKTEEAAVSLGKLSLAAGAAGAAMAIGLGIAARAAGELEEQQALLAQSIAAAGRAIDADALDKLADAESRRTGVIRAQIIEAQRNLVTFGATQAQIEKLTPVMLDLSVKTGSLGTASNLLGRALTGQDQALVRVLGRLGEGIDLTAHFDDAINVLNQRFGGLAETEARTLPGALNRVKVAFNELQTAVGAPLLGPLNAVANAFIGTANAVSILFKVIPGLSQAVAALATAVTILLVGGGGLLAFNIVVTRLTPVVLNLAAALLGPAETSALAFAGAVRLAALRVAALRAAMLALPTFALVSAIVLAVENFRTLERASASAQGYLEGFFGALVRGQNPLKGGAAGAKEWTTILFGNADAAQQAKAAEEELAKTTDQLTKEYEAAAAAAKLLSTQQQAGAARAARTSLLGAQSEADVKAIEERRLRAVSSARQEELRISIAAKETEIRQLGAKGSAYDTARKKAEQELADLSGQLEDLRRQDVEKGATATVAAVKAELEQRRALEVAGARSASETLQTELTAQRDVAQARTQAEDAERQKRLELLQLEEQVRIGMLARVADIEKQLGADILSSREGLLRAQDSQAEAQSIINAQRRADAVRRGYTAQKTAEEEAANEREENAKRHLEGELALEQARIQQIQRDFEIESSLAQAEAASKEAVLAAETESQKAQLVAQARLRIADLRASEEIAHAESVAKLAELQAQFEARKQELDLEIQAKERAGVISPEEATARRAQLAEISQEQEKVSAALAAGLTARYKAAQDQIAIISSSTAQQLTALDKEQALKRQAIEQELAGTLIKLQSTETTERAKAVQQLAALEVENAKFITDETTRLRAQGVSESTIAIRTAPQRALQQQIETLLGTQQGEAEGQVGALQTLWEQFATVLTPKLRTLKDIIDGIIHPGGAGLLGGFALPGLPTLPATAPVLAGAGGTVNQFSFNGSTFTLTADESKILSRLVAFLLGPEGNRLVERYFMSQPGGRP